VRALKENGVMRVVISGGEPLMYPDIFDVIDGLAENGISVVLGTNGTFLTNLNIHRVRKCARVEISLDAGQRALNNLMRPSRIRGGDSWTESTAAIKACLTANIPVRVLTTISRANQDQLPELAELLYQLGATDWALSWVLPAGRAASNYEDLRPDEATIQAGLKQIRKFYPAIRFRYSSRAPDQFDRFYCLILPDGQLATEDMALGRKLSFGSVLDTPMSKAWTSENFDIRAHFRKWVADRVTPLA
jgi:MoaA/NifB/PqqE/SkfB family radical SAM enzyme